MLCYAMHLVWPLNFEVPSVSLSSDRPDKHGRLTRARLLCSVDFDMSKIQHDWLAIVLFYMYIQLASIITGG